MPSETAGASVAIVDVSAGVAAHGATTTILGTINTAKSISGLVNHFASRKHGKMGYNKRPNKQAEQVAKNHGIDPHDFGDYIESVKESEGRGGADNLDWKRLNELAKEYKELHGL